MSDGQSHCFLLMNGLEKMINQLLFIGMILNMLVHFSCKKDYGGSKISNPIDDKLRG